MIVLKFGGTSVKDCQWMDTSLDIVNNQIGRAPVMVSSAMATVTNKLVDISQFAAEKNEKGITDAIEGLQKIHIDTASGFLTGDNLKNALESMDKLFKQLFSFAKGLFLLQELSPKSSDMLLSFGEKFSTIILYYRALERNISVELVDAGKIIITDNNFTSASPLYEETNKRIAKYIKPEKGKIIITQGFISSTIDGVTTTLGRGGSDFTATIIGAALDAEEVQIWTDVDGILTTDPRLVAEAKRIEKITYSEAAELAFFGAKVVHPSTILPAVKKKIPVLVKNTKNIECSGTAIIEETGCKGLTGIAGKKKITLINITSYRMLNAYGFLSKIFAVFNKYKTPVDLISTSEVSVSMTIENTKNIDFIKSELEEFGKISVESDNGIICLVGNHIWKDSILLQKVFGTLSSTSIKMISLGASDVNLSIVLPQDDIDETIKKLHKALF